MFLPAALYIGQFDKNINIKEVIKAMDREDFKIREEKVRKAANSIKNRLGIKIEICITDLEKKVLGDNDSFNIKEISEEEVEKRIFKVHTKALEEYAASVGAMLEIKEK